MGYYDPSPEEVAERRAELAPMDNWNEKIYLSLFATLCVQRDRPRAYLDLGSGTGAMVNIARKLDIKAYGVDLINGPEDWFIKHDLSKPLNLLYPSGEGKVFSMSEEGVEWFLAEHESHRRVAFDLITCIEVAEHLPPHASDILCDTINRHLAPGGILVFSAAPPGQGGEHHTNCKPAWYWRDKFYEREISYRADYTAALAHLWSWIAGPAQWVASNVQVFDCAAEGRPM